MVEACGGAAAVCGLAAAQGEADAQLMLGRLHNSGDGGPQDITEARRLFGLAAAQGYADAKCDLGTRLLMDGEGGQ